MKILNSNRDDFKKMVEEKKIDIAIKNSSGRTIMSEVVVNKDYKYGGVSDVSLLKSFGSDMITLKKYNYEVNKLDLYNSLKKDSCLLGLNFELKTDNYEFDSLTKETVKYLDESVDYVVLTVYEATDLSLLQLEEKLKLIREFYKGFILLNYYVSDVDKFLSKTKTIIDVLIKYGIDALSMPTIYTKPGIYNDDILEILKILRYNNIVSFGTVCTSQEGSDNDTIRLIALKAKELGFDGHLIGDAAACMMPEESNVYTYSVAIRGKRHTIFRMVN